VRAQGVAQRIVRGGGGCGSAHAGSWVGVPRSFGQRSPVLHEMTEI
jgi:hypothetical protein